MIADSGYRILDSGYPIPDYDAPERYQRSSVRASADGGAFFVAALSRGSAQSRLCAISIWMYIGSKEKNKLINIYIGLYIERERCLNLTYMFTYKLYFMIADSG